MSLIHLPSKRSIDITGIRYVNWNEEVFGYASENSDYKRWHSRTSIYYHINPETPVVILSNYELYDEDIQALQRELGAPQDTEKQENRCAEYQPGDTHFDEEYS